MTFDAIASERSGESEDEILKEWDIGSIDDLDTQPGPNMSDFKILVAENNATDKVLLNYILMNELKIKNLEYANDGKEASQMLKETLKKETRFDCCIIDYGMPIINGIKVIKQY